MSGHETQDDLKLRQSLEANLDFERSPIDDLVRLARLYLCPAHEDDKAGEVLRALLKRDPCNLWASYWFASYCLYSLMYAEALMEARHVLEAAIEAHPDESGALYNMLYYVRRDLAALTDGEPVDLAEQIALLEQSVHLEPSWATNRYFLARLYREAGRYEDAVSQLRAAQDNLLACPAPEWDEFRKDFESGVTGRLSSNYRDWISQMLTQLQERQPAITEHLRRFWRI